MKQRGSAENKLMELQFVGALSFSPDRIGEFPHFEKIATSDMAKAAFKALKEIKRPDAVQLSNLMTNKYREKIDPDGVTSQILALAHAYGDIDLDYSYSVLCGLYETRTGLELTGELDERIRAGEKPATVAQDFLMKARELERLHEARFISTDNWAEQQISEAKEQRESFKAGRYLTIPRCFPGIREKIPQIPRAILISILARSGAGKSGMAQELAHHWADESGETVVYFCTELTIQQMRWRRACQVDPSINYNDLERGEDDDNPELAEKLQRALAPCRNGGRVIYIDAEGMQLEEMIAICEKFRASFVIDYWDDIEIERFRQNSANESQAIHRGLQYCKGYLQRSRRNGVIITQVSKDGDQADKLRGTHANQSASFYRKSNLFLIIDGFQEMENEVNIPHPLEGDDKGRAVSILISPGERIPIGTLSVAKNTFGKGGWAEPVFMWGGRYRTVSIPKDKRRFYSNYL